MVDRKAVSIPGMLFVLYVLELVFTFLKKIDPGLYAPFDAFEKLVPILALGLCLALLKGRMSKPMAWALLFYGLYLAYGILISYLNGKRAAVIGYQLYHEIKFIAIIAVFSVIRCREQWASRSIAVSKAVLVATIPLILFQLVFSGTYDRLFSNGGHFEKGFVDGMELPRAVGSFWHPSQLALFALLTIVLLSANVKHHTATKTRYIWIYLICSVLTIQRLECTLLLCCCYAIFFMQQKYRDFLSAYFGHFILLVAGLFAASLLAKPGFYDILITELPSPRSYLFYQSIQTLVQSGYWGAGWGTIGSHAAADMTNVYSFNDLSSLWWVKEHRYLYDTYWPHILGETGLPGFFLLLISIFFMCRSYRAFNTRLMFFVLFLTSILSSNLQSVFYLTLFGWFIMVSENNARVRVAARSAATVSAPRPAQDRVPGGYRHA